MLNMSNYIRLFHVLIAVTCLWFSSDLLAQQLEPGKVVDTDFANADLPQTLFSMFTRTDSTPSMSVRLPDDYTKNKCFPLLVYVPGFHGGPKGNIGNAQTIAGARGWIVASLPLFKKSIDRDEVGGGLIVSFKDYPLISKAYKIMLGRLFDLVPNIDREHSAMVGFSNGALTVAVLVSCNDEFILTHFKNFCLVDHGMFHLTDLHKNNAKDCRYLILVGDKEDLGRDLKIRESRLQQDAWKLLGVNLTYQIMKDTGHEFQDRHMAIVGKWLRSETIDEQNTPTDAKPPTP
jgi:hypothetical protein